jgi:hypothetical protein|tara:strand:+ start:1573 stop:2016 length:444 start_codon:yes stop_codon:yes gene_type:complete
MILTDFLINLSATCLILSVYSIIVYRWLQIGELKRAGQRAFSMMGQQSGDNRRTKVLEEALVSGILKKEAFGDSALLSAGADYALGLLQDQGIEVEGRDLLLLMQSPQIRHLIEPFMSQLNANISKTVNSTTKEIEKSGRYVLKNYR